jgi:hypothetical protein
MRAVEALAGKPEDVLERWSRMTIEEKREVVRAHVRSVQVEKADPKRRRWQPIAERVVEVDWRE